MLANIISERNAPMAIKFSAESDYKSVIDAAADYISAVAFNINLYSESFVHSAAEYAKSKGLYVLSDGALSVKCDEAESCSKKHFAWADGISVTTFFNEEDLQQLIFIANKYSKDIFIYLNGQENTVRELAGQSLCMSGFSRIGCVIDSSDKEYIGRMRTYLPYCVFYVKNYKKTIIDSYFTRYCNGAIIETCVSSLEDVEKIKNLDINSLIRKGKIFL